MTSDVLIPAAQSELMLPLFHTLVPAGFPSPANDYQDTKMDLNQYLIPHPSATFFIRIQGDSMIGSGIYEGDLAIVDRSLTPQHGQAVLAVIDGDFTVKKLHKTKTELALYPANPNYDPIPITEDMNFQVWGVVTYTIHKPH
jgi:DNA polymerase V